MPRLRRRASEFAAQRRPRNDLDLSPHAVAAGRLQLPPSAGDEAIGRFGLWAGGWITLARLLRCQPWGTSGIDNVPGTLSADARWYLPWRYARWRGVNDGSEKIEN
jgi:putative component of membrane protein insertase Oxa1/YidC/SpoIIIJ protein YidD